VLAVLAVLAAAANIGPAARTNACCRVASVIVHGNRLPFFSEPKKSSGFQTTGRIEWLWTTISRR
jgi:hypothetical protein